MVTSMSLFRVIEDLSDVNFRIHEISLGVRKLTLITVIIKKKLKGGDINRQYFPTLLQ